MHEEGLSALYPSVNMRAITSRAFASLINHRNRSNTALAGQNIFSGGRQKKFNAGKTLKYTRKFSLNDLKFTLYFKYTTMSLFRC